MANLPTGYNEPQVFVDTQEEQTQPIVDGHSKVVALVGVADEVKIAMGVEVIRGSSSSMDNPVYDLDLSNQVLGTNSEFVVRPAPIVDGAGKGVITDDPSKVQVQINGEDVPVYSVKGATGLIRLVTAPMLGDRVTVSYFFKKKDTLVSNEDLSSQVPTPAKLIVPLSLTPAVSLSMKLSNPGPAGNLVNTVNGPVGVSLKFVVSTDGSSDPAAVSGSGSDTIVVDLKKEDGSIRTAAAVQDLINMFGYTQTGGFIKATTIGTASTVVDPAIAVIAPGGFADGKGQGTAYTYQVEQIPIVDGSNGGRPTTDPSKIEVKVNGIAVPVSEVDGVYGRFTTTNPVDENSSLSITYYTNTYRDTFDELRHKGVIELTQCGYSTRSQDFVNDVDYVLDSDRINWGSAALVSSKKTTPGAVPFGGTNSLVPNLITATMKDGEVYLAYCSGTIDGINNEFLLPTIPVDGTGTGRPTNKPSDLDIYVGLDPWDAFSRPKVNAVRLNAETRKFMLQAPPQPGFKVYATYFESRIDDNDFVLQCSMTGPVGVGRYTVSSTRGAVNKFTNLTHNLLDSPGYAGGRIFWPNLISDLVGQPGASPDETIFITFSADGTKQTQGAKAADTTLFIGSGANRGLLLEQSVAGTGTVVKVKAFKGVGGADGVNAVQVTGTATDYTMEINLLKSNGTVRTYADIITLLGDGTAQNPGVGITYPSLTTPKVYAKLAPQASALTLSDTGMSFNSSEYAVIGTNDFAELTGGIDPEEYATRFHVTSSRTLTQAQLDQKGLSGGVKNDPSQPEIGALGFLNQTYIDASTGVRFTLVNPADAQKFGNDNPVDIYYFKPGHVIQFRSATNEEFTASTIPEVFIPGVHLFVANTLQVPVGDQAQVSTYNRSGKEPSIGDLYYVAYRYQKPESSYEPKTWLATQESDAYAEIGAPSQSNKLALAVWIAFRNGAKALQTIQIKRDPGFFDANEVKYIEALDKLTTLYPGMARKAQIIVPLLASNTFVPYLKKHVESQSSIKMRGNCVGIFGFANGTAPNAVIAVVQGATSERMLAVYPDGGIVTISDAYGNSKDLVVGGEMVAVAYGALFADPQYDDATPRTRKQIVGFKRLFRRLDIPTMNNLAQIGVSLLEQKGSSMVVRHALTTDPSDVLSIQPQITFLKDKIELEISDVCDPYIGRKFLPSTLTDLKTSVISYFRSLVDAELIQTFGEITVSQDKTDPRIAHVKAMYVPVGELSYILVDLTIRSRND